MIIVRLVAVAAVLLATTIPVLAQPGTEDAPAAQAPMQQPPPPEGGTIVTIQPDPGQGQQPVRAIVAPINEDWNNVSHINGHPVRVGERGDYLYSFKKTNIASNPIGWMFGFYGLSVSHAVSPNIAVRADANLFDIDNETGYEFGLTVPIYFKRVYNGPFLEGGLMVRQIDRDACDWDGNCMKTEPNIGPQVMFGWHWTFD